MGWKCIIFSHMNSTYHINLYSDSACITGQSLRQSLSSLFRKIGGRNWFGNEWFWLNFTNSGAERKPSYANHWSGLLWLRSFSSWETCFPGECKHSRESAEGGRRTGAVSRKALSRAGVLVRVTSVLMMTLYLWLCWLCSLDWEEWRGVFSVDWAAGSGSPVLAVISILGSVTCELTLHTTSHPVTASQTVLCSLYSNSD